jgi:large subunit ribosomal protein L24
MKIKKGDNVIVLAGRDKGKKGKVIKAFPKKNRVLVEGINKVKKHQKPRKGGEKGQVIEVAMPIQVSNVKLDK